MCILQGPVAAKHCTVVDEPIADMLGNIEKNLIEKITERFYHGDASKIPVIDYIGSIGTPISSIPGVGLTEDGHHKTYTVGTTVPATADWLSLLAGGEVNWLRALLTSPLIVQGSAYLDNPLQRLLAPRKGQVAKVSYHHSHPTHLTVKGAIRSFGPQSPEFKALTISYDPSHKHIALTIYEERGGSSIPLHLTFNYRPDMGYAPIHENAEGRNTRIKEFYWKLWFGDHEHLPKIGLRDTLHGPKVTIKHSDVERFCAVVGNHGEAFKQGRTADVTAPMDFAIVTGWQVRCLLFPRDVGVDHAFGRQS